MKNKTKNWSTLFLFALRTLILIKILLLASPVSAQSRLGGIRNEVRNENHAEPEQKRERKRPSSSERNRKPRESQNDENDHRQDHRHEHRRSRRSRRSRGNFGHSHIDFFSCAPTQQVIHTREIHLIDPVPAYPTPVVSNAVPRQEVFQSIVEPTPNSIEEPIYDDVYISEFQNWGGRITGWYGGGIDDISQGNLSFLFQDPGGIGLDGNVRTIRERGYSDHLWMGDLNLVYEPVCSDVFRLRIGAGFNWLADSWGSDFGFNLTSGFDAKLTERVILGGEVDLGNLGHSDYLHAQLSLGYRLENVELVVGYDHTNMGSVDLDSPFAGLRFRF